VPSKRRRPPQRGQASTGIQAGRRAGCLDDALDPPQVWFTRHAHVLPTWRREAQFEDVAYVLCLVGVRERLDEHVRIHGHAAASSLIGLAAMTWPPRPGRTPDLPRADPPNALLFRVTSGLRGTLGHLIPGGTP
jgi:hypothetical protein